MNTNQNEFVEESPLETRLRRQLTTPTIGTADPRILLAIKERAASSSNDSGHVSSRRTYGAVLAVASLAIGLMAAAAISAGIGSQPIEPASSSGPARPLGPSYWWLALALLAMIGLTVALQRRFGRVLLTVGMALACAGLLFWLAMVFPYARVGSRLAADAPELEGYELVSAEVPWPSADGLTLAELRYEAKPGTEAITDDPGATTGYLAVSRRLGFNGTQNRSRCLERATNDSFDAEFYCIDPQAGTDLIVRATVFDTDGLLIGRTFALPVMILGLGLVGLVGIFAIAEKRQRATKPRSA